MGSPAHENETLARDHFERLMNDGEVDRSVLVDGYRLHSNRHEGRTVADQQAALDAYRAGFPDLHVTVEDGFATGDRVALRYTVAGTHEGAIHGVEPTNARVEFPGISVYRVEDGLLAEAWHVADTASLVDQIEAAAREREE